MTSPDKPQPLEKKKKSLWALHGHMQWLGGSPHTHAHRPPMPAKLRSALHLDRRHRHTLNPHNKKPQIE